MRCRRPSRREHVVYRVAEPVVNSERQKSGRSGSPRGEGVSLAVNRRRALKSSARASRSSTSIPAVTGCALPSTRRVVRSVSSSVITASWRWLSAVCKQHTIGSLIGCSPPSTRRAVRSVSSRVGVVGQWGGGADGAVCEDHRPVTGGALRLAACDEKIALTAKRVFPRGSNPLLLEQSPRS